MLSRLLIDQGNLINTTLHDPEVYHEIKTLNTEHETILERIEEDMNFKIPGLPHFIVKQLQSASVREWIQKIENHPKRHALQRDLTSNCVICSTRNPKRSAKYVHHTGTLASEIPQVHDGPPFCSSLLDKEKATSRAPLREKAGRQGILHRQPAEEEVQEEQEYCHYKSNWWLRSNKTGFDTMPIRRRSDFKQALSTLQQLNEKEEAQRNQRWTQSHSPRRSWQSSRWTP